MTIIKWRDSYNTGVEQFDQEHHKIVELINSMYFVVRDQVSREEVEKLVSELISYTEYHFDNEEKAMAAANYPLLEDHRQEHEKLREEAITFRALLEGDFINGARNFYRFLREWLMVHILECDMKYSKKISLS